MHFVETTKIGVDKKKILSQYVIEVLMKIGDN